MSERGINSKLEVSANQKAALDGEVELHRRENQGFPAIERARVKSDLIFRKPIKSSIKNCDPNIG